MRDCLIRLAAVNIGRCFKLNGRSCDVKIRPGFSQDEGQIPALLLNTVTSVCDRGRINFPKSSASVSERGYTQVTVYRIPSNAL